MGVRSIAVTVAFMLLGVMAVGVADAATEDWETVAVGAVWNRKALFPLPQHPGYHDSLIELDSETQRNPTGIRLSVTSKNERVPWATIGISGACHNGRDSPQIDTTLVALPYSIEFDMPGDTGQCFVSTWASTYYPETPGGLVGKIRLKIEAKY